MVSENQLSLSLDPAGNECNDTDVRLVDGGSELEGRLEICFGGIWGTVCSDYNYDYHYYEFEEAAAVVCRQLGFSPWSKQKLTLTMIIL